MATIQDLMQKNHEKKLKDLLDKFKKGAQHFAEGGTVQPISDEDLKKLVQRDVEPAPEDSADDIFSQMGHPPDYPESSKGGELVGDSYLPSDATRKFQLDDLINATKTKNAVAKNPVGDVKSGVTVGEPYTPKDNLPAIQSKEVVDPSAKPSVDPESVTPSESDNLPAKSPQVMGEGTSTSAMPAEEPTDAEFQEVPPNLMAKMGVNGAMLMEAGIPLAAAYAPEAYDAIKDKLSGPAKITPPNIPAGNNNGATTPPTFAPDQPAKILGPYDPNRPQPSAQTPPNGGASGSWDYPPEQPQTDTPPAPVNPLQALLNAYKGTQDTHAQDLKDAQAKAAQNELVGNAFKGLNQINSGITGLGQHGIAAPAQVDNSALDGILKNANVPVTNYQQNTDNEKNDPNSQYSKGLQAFIGPTFAKLGVKVDPSTLSAATIEKIAPQATTMYDQQLKSQWINQGNELKAKLAQNKQDTKGDDKQDKALQQTQALLESARGNPEVSQALKDRYNAQKANSLVNLYGDPNKLSTGQAQLVYNEVAKIAAGGVPTHEEMAAINPGALEGKLAGVWQKLSNAPTPANAGAFLKQYQDYANALGNDAQNVINDKLGRILATRHAQLGEDNYNTLHENYIGGSARKFKAQGGSGQAVTPGQTTSNPTSQVNNSDMVKVVSPDGQPGSIPRSNLAAAKARGFKEVQ